MESLFDLVEDEEEQSEEKTELRERRNAVLSGAGEKTQADLLAKREEGARPDPEDSRVGEKTNRPEWEFDRMREAVKRTEGELWIRTAGMDVPGAQLLYRAIRTDRLRGAEQERRNTMARLREVEDRAAGNAVVDIRALDQVFQRDARRYDGGLKLL